jgi:hypothetical protein
MRKSAAIGLCLHATKSMLRDLLRKSEGCRIVQLQGENVASKSGATCDVLLDSTRA